MPIIERDGLMYNVENGENYYIESLIGPKYKINTIITADATVCAIVTYDDRASGITGDHNVKTVVGEEEETHTVEIVNGSFQLPKYDVPIFEIHVPHDGYTIFKFVRQ